MRLYRKRRREGMRYVRIPLHVTKIDDLVRLGFLRGEQCQDPEALQMAVLGIIYGVWDQCGEPQTMRGSFGGAGTSAGHKSAGCGEIP